MLTDQSRQQDFPWLAGRTYLNTAAEGIPPRPVVDALQHYAQDKMLGMDGRKLHEARWRSLKEQVAAAYGLTAEEIGLCSCSSEAYNLAALALQLRPGDEVIINDLDFPAGATPWLQPSCPATVKIWHASDWVLHVEDLVALLSSRTRLVNVSLVSFFNGYALALPDVVAAVRRNSDALLAVDVTQALGRIPLEVSGADLIISSTHKWILGAHGGGLVGVPAQRAEQWTVPAGGWFNLQDPFGADRFDRVESKPGAASFSVGMPGYGAVYAANAAMEYINGIGAAAIDAYARPLVHACIEGLKQLPVELITPDDDAALAGIVAFRHPDSERIHQHLHQRDIHLMQHAGRLRIAIHGYNTVQDVERVLGALKEALSA